MPDISTPNLDYNDMVEAWDINDALMGGTLEMRRQGKKYLPKWPNEDPESYKERLASAALQAQITAGYMNVLDTAWPRFRYTLNEYPGLRYMS